jgi:hypothetical protein
MGSVGEHGLDASAQGMTAHEGHDPTGVLLSTVAGGRSWSASQLPGSQSRRSARKASIEASYLGRLVEAALELGGPIRSADSSSSQPPSTRISLISPRAGGVPPSRDLRPKP